MRFARQALYTFTGNIGVGIFSLLLAILHSRLFGAEGKGVITLLVLVPSLVALAMDGGISIYTVFECGKDGQQKNQVLALIRRWLILVAPASILVSLSILYLVAQDFQGIGLPHLLIAALLCPSFLFLGLLRSYALGLQRVILFNISNLLQPLSILLLTVAGFMILGVEILAAVSAYLIGLLLLTIHIYFKSGPSSVKAGSLLPALRFGFLGHIGTLVQYLNYRLDVVLLALLGSASEVGIYSVSYTCAEVIWRLPRAVGTVLFPKIASLKADDATMLTGRVVRITNMLLLVICIFAGLIGPLVIQPVFGQEFSASVTPFLLLLPGVFFFGWHNTLIEDLKGRGKPIAKLYTASIGLAFTIALDLLLIPRFGAVGAALATSCAYSVAAIASVVLYCRHTNERFASVILPRAEDLQFFTRGAN